MTRLPRLRGDDAAAANRLRSGGSVVACTVLGQRLRIRLEAPRDDAPGLPWRCAWPVGTDVLDVRLDGVEAVLPGVRCADWPGDEHQRLAMVDAVAAALWSALGERDDDLPRPRVCVPEADGARPGTRADGLLLRGVIANLDTGARSVVEVDLRGHAHASNALMQAWRRWAARAGAAAPAHHARVPVPVAFRVGTVGLTAMEARRLAHGDVLVLGRLPSFEGQWACDVVVGIDRACRARGIVEGDRIVVKNVVKDVTKEAATGVEGAAASALERAQVTLGFEIGRRAIPLGDLLRLAPGHVFDLGTDPAGEVVDIVVQHERVGRGQLVLVGDTLGVRVMSFDLDGDVDDDGPVADVPGAPVDVAV